MRHNLTNPKYGLYFKYDSTVKKGNNVELKRRDKDLKYHEPKTRKIIVKVRDIFDECKDANPRWLPGLLLEEMFTYGLIAEEQLDRLRREIGL